MKKFISMMITVAMLLSLCVVGVHAATVANPIINVYSEPFDGTGASSTYYNPTGYDVYKVWYTTEGIDAMEDTIRNLVIKFTIDDSSKVAAKSWLEAKLSGKGTRDQNGTLSYNVQPSLISEGCYQWNNATDDGVDAFDWVTYPDGGTYETLPYVETLIYVTEGETVTFTYNTAFNGPDPTSQIIIDRDGDEVKYNTALQYKINGTVGNTLTLGSVTTTYTIGFQDKDGTAIGTAATYNAGDTVTPPTAPTVPGYTFAYWSTDGINNDWSSTAVADATYKAVYTKDAVPATKVTISGAAKAKVGATVELTAVVEPEGSDTPIATFTGTGVTDGKDNTATVTSATAGDVVVTAIAGSVSNTFTVTFIEDAPAVLTNKTPLAVKDAKVVEASTEGAESIYVTKAAFTPDFTNFIYKAWAREDGSEERHYFDQTINSKLDGKIEGSGAFDFILMIKSATHKIVDCGIETFIQ